MYEPPLAAVAKIARSAGKPRMSWMPAPRAAAHYAFRPHSMSLKQTVFSGVFWRSGGQVINQIVQLVISVILARLLTPEDYGLVAMAGVFISFAALFGELGLSVALIQRKDITATHMDTVFWTTLGLGTVLAAAFWGISPWIAEFYGEPVLNDVVPILALGFALAPLGTVQRALLIRTMKLRALAIVTTGTTAASGILAISLALNGFGLWSLIWSALFGKLVDYFLLTRLSTWKPRRRFCFSALKDLWSFGANLTVNGVITFCVSASDRLLIGKFMGAHDVGIYNRAYAAMLAPFSQIVWVLTFVMFPVLSSIQEDQRRIRDIFLRALTVTSFVTAPMLVGLAIVAEPFIIIVFGSKWIDAVPILQLFCGLGLVQMVTQMIGPVMESQGRPNLMVKLSLVQGILSLVGVAVGLLLGRLEIIALAVLLANLLMLWPWLKLGGGLVGIGILDIFNAVSGNLGCALIMAIAVWQTEGLLRPAMSTSWQLFFCVCTGGIIYITAAFLLKTQGWRLSVGLLHETLSPIFRKQEPQSFQAPGDY